MRYLEDHPKLGSASDLSVVAFGALGGRLDQTMANINMLYRFRSFKRFVLLSSHSLAFLLPAGLNVIEPNFDLEEGTCGLIPLSGQVDSRIPQRQTLLGHTPVRGRLHAGGRPGG